MTSKIKSLNVNTRIVHAGAGPDKQTGAICSPIYQTSIYVQTMPERLGGYSYSRTANPTRTELEQVLAEIEYGKYALSFSSGVAAIDCLMKTLSPGDEVVCAHCIYGGTNRLFTVYRKFGIRIRYADMNNANDISLKINEKTKIVWVETPSNPLLSVTDISLIAAICKKQSVLFCVDNTFATPYLQNPLREGADIVIHSASKYLGGHSDVILGAIVTNSERLYKKMKFIQNSAGAIPGPFDCFLVLRGIRTLHVRMKFICENTAKVAHYLRNHQFVKKVYWCGFPDDPGHETARKQMRDFGGVVGFEIKRNADNDPKKLLGFTKLIAFADSLGGIESIINHPFSMSHQSLNLSEKKKAGIDRKLIRLSIGIEDADDIIKDLDQALLYYKNL